MEKFKQKYEQERTKDNFDFIDPQTLRDIITNLKGKIKDGKIYKGKAGENFRIYTCRLLECFALCKVEMEKDDIAIFKVFRCRFRILLNKILKILKSQSYLQQSNA